MAHVPECLMNCLGQLLSFEMAVQKASGHRCRGEDVVVRVVIAETIKPELIECNRQKFAEFGFCFSLGQSGDESEGHRFDSFEEGLHRDVDDIGCGNLGASPQCCFFEEVAERWIVDRSSGSLGFHGFQHGARIGTMQTILKPASSWSTTMV